MILCSDMKCTIHEDNQIVGEAYYCGNKLFELQLVSKHRECAAQVKVDLHQWHRRLGHRDPAAVQRLITEKLADGIEVSGDCSKLPDRNHCVKGKMAALPFPISTTRSKEVLDLTHSDVCGPTPTTTPSGMHYGLMLIDDYSRFTHIRLLKNKDKVTGVIWEFVDKMTTRFG